MTQQHRHKKPRSAVNTAEVTAAASLRHKDVTSRFTWTHATMLPGEVEEGAGPRSPAITSSSKHHQLDPESDH